MQVRRVRVKQVCKDSSAGKDSNASKESNGVA